MSDSQPYNESELLFRLAQGSEPAFKTLFMAYKDKLYNYVFKLSGSSETAEDTVHDVFLKLWIKRAELPDMQNLNAYLYSMARNHSLNLFRRMAKEGLILSEIQRSNGWETGYEGEDHISHKEIIEVIRDAVDKLTPQQKQVFVLSRQQGLKLGEIADQLGISERTVKNHMTEALRLLREAVRRQYGYNAIIIFVVYNLTAF